MLYLFLSSHPVVNVLLYLGCVPDDRAMAWVEQRGRERAQSMKGPQVATKILKHLPECVCVLVDHLAVIVL